MKAMEKLSVENLFEPGHTIAWALFDEKEYPWEVLSDIGAFIVKLGETLGDRFVRREGDIWIAKSSVRRAHGRAARAAHHRRGRGDPPLRVHPRQGDHRKKRGRGQFDRG